MPVTVTRKILVYVTEVVFDCGEIWTSNPEKWYEVMPQKTIDSYLEDKELIKQYFIETSEECKYYPELRDDLFLCTCGTANNRTTELCINCKRSYSKILESLDKRILNRKCEERLEIEREEEEIAQRKEKERQILEEKKRKRSIVFAVAIFSLIIITIVFVVCYPDYIKPTIEKNTTYRNANKLLEEEKFDEAKELFDELGAFRKSSEKSKETVYKKADSLCQIGHYDEALELFQSIPDYTNANEKVFETKYLKASDLESKACYEEAISIWNDICDYSDSKDRITSAETLWKEPDYLKAQSLMDEKNFLKPLMFLEN